MVGTKRCFVRIYPIYFQIVLASTVFVICTVIRVKPKGIFFSTYGTRKRYTQVKAVPVRVCTCIPIRNNDKVWW